MDANSAAAVDLIKKIHKGELEKGAPKGHPFYGNQYTTGSGSPVAPDLAAVLPAGSSVKPMEFLEDEINRVPGVRVGVMTKPESPRIQREERAYRLYQESTGDFVVSNMDNTVTDFRSDTRDSALQELKTRITRDTGVTVGGRIKALSATINRAKALEGGGNALSPGERKAASAARKELASLTPFREGTRVKVTGPVSGKGKTLTVRELSPSGKYAVVRDAKGNTFSYHLSDLTPRKD